MIWILRALSLALGAVLFLVLLLTLVFWQLGGFFLDPDSYASLLDENDLYEFALADLPTAVLEDRRAVEEAKTGDNVEDTPLLASGLTTDRIVAALNRAVPPDWLQDTVERNIDELGGYVTGQSDDFTLVIGTDERADVLLAELRALLEEADAYAVLHERVLVPRIEEAAADWARERLPFGVEVSDERIAAAARAVLPPEWARVQGQRIFDEATPYVKGESDELVISVRLADRVDVAAGEVKDILAESQTYDLLYDEVIAPKITERLGETIEGLPFGATLSSDEVVEALRDAAPPSWVRAQAERLIDEAGPYIAGQVGGFEFKVSLVENKRLAGVALTFLVHLRLREHIDRLPVCRTIEEARSALGSGRTQPTCIPPGIDPNLPLEVLGIDLGAEMARLVWAPIPNSVSFSHERLRDELETAGSADGVERLDEIRSLLRDGWTYTEDDLREDLTARGNEAVYDALQDARSAMADGWTYTQDDLAEDVIESVGADAMANIDRGRGAISAVRTYRWLLFLPALLLLTGVGLLGGRDWWGRVVWGAASLIVCAVAVAVLSGLVYPAVASGLIDEARWQAVGDVNPADDYAGTGRLVAGKAFDVIESVSDTLAAAHGSRPPAWSSPSSPRSSSPRSSTGTGSRSSSGARGAADRRPLRADTPTARSPRVAPMLHRRVSRGARRV